jgi:hypothetical protein
LILSGLVLDTALWNALPTEVSDGALGSSDKSDQPDSTFFGSLREKDPVLVQLQPVGYEVVAESDTIFWNSQGNMNYLCVQN